MRTTSCFTIKVVFSKQQSLPGYNLTAHLPLELLVPEPKEVTSLFSGACRSSLHCSSTGINTTRRLTSLCRIVAGILLDSFLTAEVLPPRTSRDGCLTG